MKTSSLASSLLHYFFVQPSVASRPTVVSAPDSHPAHSRPLFANAAKTEALAGTAPDTDRVVNFGTGPSSPTIVKAAKPETELASVVQLASWVFQPIAAHKHISLVVDAPATGLVAVCDEVRIQRVLENLLSNAIKASPVGSTITLAARRENGWLRFSVDDAGPGVAASDQPNLFDEPTSFMDILDADDCGTNRGLVVCQHIITTHGGDLAMHNRPEGGAHFEFRLPTSANSTTSSVQSDLVSIHPSIAAVA